MGVLQLLSLLRYAREDVEAKSYFEGKKLLIDGYVWLHEAINHHARDLVVMKNINPVISEMIWRCKTHLKRGSSVLVVLDGARHASKHATNELRLRRRLQKVAEVDLALEHDETGLTIDDKLLQYAAYISAELVDALIDAFRANGIAYLRAPYK
jgi:5'-3' exonuclease